MSNCTLLFFRNNLFNLNFNINHFLSNRIIDNRKLVLFFERNYRNLNLCFISTKVNII